MPFDCLFAHHRPVSDADVRLRGGRPTHAPPCGDDGSRLGTAPYAGSYPYARANTDAGAHTHADSHAYTDAHAYADTGAHGDHGAL